MPFFTRGAPPPSVSISFVVPDCARYPRQKQARGSPSPTARIPGLPSPVAMRQTPEGGIHASSQVFPSGFWHSHTTPSALRLHRGIGSKVSASVRPNALRFPGGFAWRHQAVGSQPQSGLVLGRKIKFNGWIRGKNIHRIIKNDY